jgi:hypothetical protein
MTALTDHAAGFHRDKNLEPRELRVGVEEQGAADHECRPDADNQHVNKFVVHHSPPVELVPASWGAVRRRASAGDEAADSQRRAVVGVVIVRRPNRYREWRWSC